MGWGSSWSRLLHVFSLNASHLFIYYILEQDRLPISLFQLEQGGGLLTWASWWRGRARGDALQGRDPPQGAPREPPVPLQVSPKAPVRMDLTLAVPGR